MPRFSAFWLTHYKEIGNCCMTAPLKKLKVRNNVKVEVPDKFQSLQLVEDYIDTGWMDQKKLKWIGWDIQGWYAWTDPNGMLYRIKDLQRNEDGREYEKEVEEIVASGDPRTHQGNPTARELYTFERDMQRNCGFCPDGSGDGDSDDAEQEGGKKDDTKKENIADDIDLDKLMQGDITDFMPGDDEYVPKAPVTDATEVTETVHITDNPYVPTPGGADDGSGILKEIIDDLPILPPTPMQVPANKQKPVLNTTKVTDTSKVATPAKNPFQQKMAERQKAHEEPISFPPIPIKIDKLIVATRPTNGGRPKPSRKIDYQKFGMSIMGNSPRQELDLPHIHPSGKLFNFDFAQFMEWMGLRNLANTQPPNFKPEKPGVEETVEFVNTMIEYFKDIINTKSEEQKNKEAEEQKKAEEKRRAEEKNKLNVEKRPKAYFTSDKEGIYRTFTHDQKGWLDTSEYRKELTRYYKNMGYSDEEIRYRLRGLLK
jgi:hypothetical protein